MMMDDIKGGLIINQCGWGEGIGGDPLLFMTTKMGVTHFL